jgi:hypothetical protein
MPNYDFECTGPEKHTHEISCSIADSLKQKFCPTCYEPMKRLISCPHINDPNKVILDYPGSKKLKAGYVHSHGDKVAEKTSVGYGGIIQANNFKHSHPLVDSGLVKPEFRTKSQAE